jgi:hypothetical protein
MHAYDPLSFYNMAISKMTMIMTTTVATTSLNMLACDVHLWKSLAVKYKPTVNVHCIYNDMSRDAWRSRSSTVKTGKLV